MATPPDKGCQWQNARQIHGAIPAMPSPWLQRRDWAIPPRTWIEPLAVCDWLSA
jgi:hypothetical protein